MLCLSIGGATVAELQARMSIGEFIEWKKYYSKWPFDITHTHYRPAALMAFVSSGGDDDRMQKMLDWLDPQDDGLTSADRDIFRMAGVMK